MSKLRAFGGLAFVTMLLVPSNAVAAKSVDPAMQFVINMILGETQGARNLIAGTISQHQRQPVAEGRGILSPAEFFSAIAPCPISDFRSISLATLHGRQADIFVGWHCPSFALEARVRSVGTHIEISDFAKLPYIAPPPPPKESQ